MCSEDLCDPYNGLPYRKRTKLNHTSGILHHLLENYRQCDETHVHQPIEGMTKYRDAKGNWKTINRTTFAGWYTRPFCEDIVDGFTQEFAIRDQADHMRKSSTRCVRFRLPNQTFVAGTSRHTSRGPYLPTKIFDCEHCSPSFSSVAARRLHMTTKHPDRHAAYQQELLRKGGKRVKVHTKYESTLETDNNVVTLGTRLAMPGEKILDLTQQLQAFNWPRSSRYFVPGHGCCLGATANDAGPFLHPLNHRLSGLIQSINACIRQALSGKHFYWGSLQINKSLWAKDMLIVTA